MKDRIREIDKEYGFNLSEDEIESIAKQAEETHRLLQDLYKVHPDPNFFPNFDDNLADAMRLETETFFNDLVEEDRSILDLFRADYTFVNERLATHYGFPPVPGAHFRKVGYPDDRRVGSWPRQRAGPHLAGQTAPLPSCAASG